MDKFLKTLIETAVAPIVALLTEIRDRLPVASQAVPPQASPAAAPAPPVTVAPAVASKVTREVIGQTLLALARSSEAGLATAQALLTKYVPIDQETKTLAFVPEDKYIALFVDLSAATAPTSTPAKAAESLI